MTATDETFLDDLFERTLEQLLAGATPEPLALAADQQHLTAQALELVALARAVAGSRATAAPARFVGDYELIEELGRGASSIVYLARQRTVGGRLVALKVLAGGPWANERARQRFRAEVAALARVQHPNVVPVLDVVDATDSPAYAMTWIRGRSLADLIQRRRDGSAGAGTDPAALAATRFVPFVCRLGVQIANALQAVHDAGLLHRDVKPSNVLIDERGEPHLSDFGLVRDEQASLHTRTGDFVGTLAYSSPEQLRGDPVDARTDVHGLGATLWHAFTGMPPGRGQTVAQALAALERSSLRSLRAERPELPRDLEAVVHKAMAFDPRHRYASAREFAADLQRLLDLQPVQARRPGPGYRVLRFVQRQRALVFATLAGAVLVTLAFAAAWWHAQSIAEHAARLDARIEAARLLLLDPGLGSRLAAQVRRGAPVDVGRTLTLIERCIAAHGELLALAPARADLRLEQATLRVAAARLAGTGPGPDLATECPTADAYARGEAAPLLEDTTAVDARALGVLAWLGGDLDRAVAAFEHVERRGAADPFVDGLLGMVLGARGDPQRALPRAVRLAERFPDRGPLQIEAAAIAAACGDVPMAQRFVAAADAAGEAPLDSAVQLVRGDLAWLAGDDRAAEACYQHANAYGRQLALWLARRAWPRAIVGALNIISLEPNAASHRRALLRAARAWWAERTAEERQRLLAQAAAGGLCEVGQLFGVMAGVARAHAALRAATAAVPPLVSAAGRERFDGQLDAESHDEFDDLVRRIGVEQLDLTRLAAAPEAVRNQLAAAWLDRGGNDRAAALLAGLGARRPDQADPFALPVDRPLPPPLVEARELARPNLSFDAIWLGSTAALGGVAPRLASAGGAKPSSPEAHRGIVELRALDGTLVAAIAGPEPFDGLGGTVANVGDLDGDGQVDAACATTRRRHAGKPEQVLLVSGRDGRVLRVCTGDAPGEGFGTSIVGLGDVDGDGASEVAIGIPQASRDGRARCGAVRVFSLDGRVVHESAGAAPFDAFGQRLAALGDVDGDGATDFAVGSECQTPPLYAELRSGRTGHLLRRVEDTRYRLGSTGVAGAGDTDGDTVPDLLIGFATLVPWQPPDGRVVLVSGKDGTTLREFTGERSGEGFGTDVGLLGDLDGDGIVEFGIAANCEISTLPPVTYVVSANGAQKARLPGVFRLFAVRGSPQLGVLTLGVWNRYATQPMASSARVALARWSAPR